MGSTVNPTYRKLTGEERALLDKDDYSDDLRDGRMAVYTYTITAAARVVEELEDGCDYTTYFAEVGDGTLVYLNCPMDELMQQLRVNCLPRTGEIVGFEQWGEPLGSSCMPAYLVTDIEKIPGEPCFLQMRLDDIADAFGLQPIETSTPTSVDMAQLPKTLHPGVRHYQRGFIAYAFFGVILLGIGLGPLIYAGVPLLFSRDGDIISWSPLLGTLPFLLAPIIGLPYLAKGMHRYQDLLRLASRAISTISLDQLPIVFHYSLTYDGSKMEKRYQVEVPAEYARAHGLPRRFDILPPIGPVKKTLAKIDWSRTGKKDDYEQDVLSETAAVHLDPSGMVVIDTSQGLLIRQLQ